jgi:hypothetical protein
MAKVVGPLGGGSKPTEPSFKPTPNPLTRQANAAKTAVGKAATKVSNVGKQLKAAPAALGAAKDKAVGANPVTSKIRDVGQQLGAAKDLAIKDVTKGFPKAPIEKPIQRREMIKSSNLKPMSPAKAAANPPPAKGTKDT